MFVGKKICLLSHVKYFFIFFHFIANKVTRHYCIKLIFIDIYSNDEMRGELAPSRENK